MAYTYTEIHGFHFEIDTMDWRHTDDAEICAEFIEEALSRWTPAAAAKYHAALIRLQSDEIEPDDDSLEPIRNLENAAASAILSTYASWPDSGHNSIISAVNA